MVFLSLFAVRRLEGQEAVQRYVDYLMQGRSGAVLVSNPASGRIRAVWNADVAGGRAFPPGSTAKLVESAAALEEGMLSPSERIRCRRVPELLGERYHCVHPPADEPYDLPAALANSCNYFFSALSARLSPATLAHWYSIFGFGTPAAVPGCHPAAGEVRIGAEASAKALAALGEGGVLATPAQVLLAYSAVAMRGAVYRLHRGGPDASPSPLRRIKLGPRTLDLLTAGLEQCAQAGTCRAAAVPGVRVAGKTGTAADRGSGGRTHAWFVGYAPIDRPRIALVILLGRGTGAHDAAPLAGRILRRYFATGATGATGASEATGASGSP